MNRNKVLETFTVFWNLLQIFIPIYYQYMREFEYYFFNKENTAGKYS